MEKWMHGHTQEKFSMQIWMFFTVVSCGNSWTTKLGLRCNKSLLYVFREEKLFEEAIDLLR